MKDGAVGYSQSIFTTPSSLIRTLDGNNIMCLHMIMWLRVILFGATVYEVYLSVFFFWSLYEHILVVM